MINYEDALKKAKELKENIDLCDEYDKGYMFKSSLDEWAIGGDGPCCILKETGEAINQTEFYDKYKPTLVKEMKIKKGK